MIHQVADNWNR